MATAISMANAYIQAGQESVFATGAATIAVPFGRGQLVSKTSKNNLIQIRGLGDRTVQQLVAGSYDGVATITWNVASGYFFKMMMGQVKDGGATPYTHEYHPVSNTALPSFTLEVGNDLDTDSVIRLLGCKINRLTLSGTIGEAIKATAEVMYANESEAASLDTSVATDSETVFTFGDMSVELPDGSTITDVQRFEVIFENNLIPVRGLGSRYIQQAPAGNFNVTFTLEAAYESSARLLEEFYGSATGPATSQTARVVNMVITNGLLTSSMRKIDLMINGCKLDQHDYNADNIDDVIKETVNGIGTGTAG